MNSAPSKDRKPGQKPDLPAQSRHPNPCPWKLLVVDDDPDIPILLQTILASFVFDGRPVEIIIARSAAEARERLKKDDRFAAALIDIVMEAQDAGLRLVEFIRNTLNNPLIRLIILTAQTKQLPKQFVMDHFDVDNYKEKTHLHPQHLLATVRSALKSYRDLHAVDAQRRGLETILAEMPKLYLHPTDSPAHFYENVLSCVVALCRISYDGLNRALPDDTMVCIAIQEETGLEIRARYGNPGDATLWEVAIKPRLEAFLQQASPSTTAQETDLIIPLAMRNRPVGCVYLENWENLGVIHRNLLQIFISQCASALENRQLRLDLQNMNEGAFQMLAVAAEFKDSATGNHIKRLARQTTQTAIEMGIPPLEAAEFGQASMMHDIGKIGIPDSILMKPTKLTDDEFEVIKSHPGIGGNILQENMGFKLAREVSLSHHEKWNGTGYPLGLRGEEIPLAARIVAVVDVFDALISKRPYKKAWTIQEALTKIEQGSESHFDPKVVDAFLNLHSKRGQARRKKMRKGSEKNRRSLEK